MEATKTATVIGASGLIGSHLLALLLDDDYFSKIKVITRRPVAIANKKAEMMVIDFADDDAFKDALAGSDVIFSAVGTTQSKVKGDKSVYRKIDFDIPVHAAQYGLNSGCQKFLFVSSVGANSNGNNFYLKLKGEIEDAVKQTGISYIGAFRPSMLLGDRKESRPMEKIMQAVSKGISFLLPSKYKPIEARDVAAAMIQASKTHERGFHVYHYTEMKEIK